MGKNKKKNQKNQKNQNQEVFPRKVDDKTLEGVFRKLSQLYASLPDTQNCLDYIKKPKEEGGCGAWCCFLNNPQVLYVEFLYSWKNALQNWSFERIIKLVEAALQNYMKPSYTKSCIFWDSSTKLCTQHTTRPLACFLPDTWVYTSDGTKTIKDILPGDLVLGNDSKWHTVISTLGRFYHGNIYNVKPHGQSLDCWCTADHMWNVIYQLDKQKTPYPHWCRADELITKRNNKYGHYLMIPTGWQDNLGLNQIDKFDYKVAIEKLEHGNVVYIPLYTIDCQYYEGPVIDIQVEDVQCFATSSGVAHNCHLYGITPEEEFRPKYERLKVLYQDDPMSNVYEQCGLIEPVNGENPTKEDIDRWWDQLVEIEKQLGVPEEYITDEPGGTYRTYHDHLLMHLCDNETLQLLQDARLYGGPRERQMVVTKLIADLREGINTEVEKNNESTSNEKSKST